MKVFKSLVFLSCLLTSAAATADNVNVIEASYGLNCSGNLRGNMTDIVKDSCKGKQLCDFTVDHMVHGDPAHMCPKNFVVEYRCGIKEKKRAQIAPEASKNSIALDCTG